MGTDVLAAVCSQPGDQVEQPTMECVTPTERLLLRFYRTLDERDQAFMRQAIEAMATRTSTD